jgi:hypothetical protein
MLIIEEPGRDRLRWIRTAMAAFATSASMAAGTALWEYGRQAGGAAPDVSCIMFVTTGVHLAGTKWLRRRGRRADFRWRAALVLPDGVHPGLLGRWSRSALALDTVTTIGFVGGALLFSGGQVGAGSVRSGAIWSTLAGAAAVALAVSAFGRLRRSGYVAITSHGVAVGGHIVRWEQIGAVYRDKEGVHLRLKTPENSRYVGVSGPDCAVSDERLAEVIEFYLANPHRRSALDTGPDQLALPAHRGPRQTPSKTASRCL